MATPPQHRIVGVPWTYVRPFPAEEVTTRDEASEVDPRDAGLTSDDVNEIWRSVVRLYETRLHPAIALCVRRRGKVVVNRAIGHLQGNSPEDLSGSPLVLARPDSLFSIYSASKAVTAMLVHLLDDRGLLHLDDPVVEYIPEFGRHGKEWITLRHILTHRAGIPAVPPQTKITPELIARPKLILDLLCDSKPLSLPGRKLAYHAITGGYVLGEIIERITGTDLRTVLRREVCEPLGMKHFNYGVAPEDIPNVAVNAFTGPPPLPPLSWLLEKSLGVSLRDASSLSNEWSYLTSIMPAGNIICTPDEASRFFQLLLAEGEIDGTRVFSRRTVRRAIAAQSFLEFDAVLAMPISYGMGFMLGSKWFSLFGHDTTRAFGHLGFTGVVVWADPERDISVALMTTGKPFITPEQVIWLNIARTIARRCPKVA
jgi:CubicO group peptidase (beta-lactamase class C family)